ncbi:MAG TPA: threonine synthase [Anaerolineae bacterium]|nr:threonine synthase [Anaerolineae bacterium]
MSYLSHLECSECRQTFDAHVLHNLCPACGAPLWARYDLDRARRELDRDHFAARPGSLWAWYELLPIDHLAQRIDLGEGGTPLLRIDRLAAQLGLTDVWLKDEGRNPTGSFKARGMAAAVTRAKTLGVTEFVVPTAGNAGGAAAAYAARAGMAIHVYMPRDAPAANVNECLEAGADVHLIDGLINDAGRLAAADAQEHGWFDLATLKEPYRVEGKKTMGYEIAQDFDWQLPDVIIYPTGGGTGLIGIWKAFDEMETLGWIGAKRPRMVAVQAEGCQPIVTAFAAQHIASELHQHAQTVAAGLRVPRPLGDRAILRALRASHGTAIAVSDADIVAMTQAVLRTEGVSMAFEGAATLVAAQQLRQAGWLSAAETIVCLNTGAGWKNPSRQQT